MERTYTHIGEPLRARREALGFTQQELCARLGWKVSRSNEISDIENGVNKNPTLQRLIALSHALNWHVSDLVYMLNTESQAV